MELSGGAVTPGLGATQAVAPGLRLSVQPARRRYPSQRWGRVTPTRRLDGESQAWCDRLRGPEPRRDRGALSSTSAYGVRRGSRHPAATRGMSGFPRSDLDDLAVEAAGDALLSESCVSSTITGATVSSGPGREDSAQLEARVSIRRGTRQRSPRDLAQARVPRSPTGDAHRRSASKFRSAAKDQRIDHRRPDGAPASRSDRECDRRRLTTTLATELDTTPGAIYKRYDARKKLTASVALL